MSRYQRLALAPLTRDELAAGLTELGLTAEWADAHSQLELAGSLECTGEPVDVRLPAGTLGAVEDLGFVLGPAPRPSGPGSASAPSSSPASSQLALVCGELDRNLLERRLLAPLTAAVAAARARAAATAAGLAVDEHLEADGTRRLLLTPRVTPGSRPR